MSQNTGASVGAGAVSGAATGAMLGGPYGAIIGAVVGAGLSLWQSASNRGAASRQMNAMAAGASLEIQQTDDAFRLQRRKLSQRGQIALGSLRASAAERGLTTAEGLGEAMVSVQLANDAIDQQINETNRRNRIAVIRRNYEAGIVGAQQMAGNLLVDTLQGATSGALAGSQLGSNFDRRNLNREIS